MNDTEKIVHVGEVIYDSIRRENGGDPTTLKELAIIAESKYGLILERVKDDPKFTAELAFLRDDVALLRWNSTVDVRLQMCYMIHEIAEYIVRSRDDGLDVPILRGSLTPQDACHYASIECEKHLAAALRKRGIDTSEIQENINSRAWSGQLN